MQPSCRQADMRSLCAGAVPALVQRCAASSQPACTFSFPRRLVPGLIIARPNRCSLLPACFSLAMPARRMTNARLQHVGA